MYPHNVTINDHREIIDKCKGCDRVMYCVITKMYICACHVFPHTRWWFGLPCEQATHIKDKEEC